MEPVQKMRAITKATMEPSSSSSRHKATANTCRLFRLPNALIFDILSRLPVNSLLHCRCVSKRFLCFVSDPEFARLHLSRSPLCILLNYKTITNAPWRLQLAHVDADGADLQVSKLDFTPKFNVPGLNFFSMSACNGLVCFGRFEKADDFLYSFLVCNPILGEYITIRPPNNIRFPIGYWGLGYSTVTNQFKVLHIYRQKVGASTRAEIYTIGTGTWRSLGNAPADGRFILPFNAFLNGALHWCDNPSIDIKTIHTFDFNTEEFGTVLPPANSRKEGERCSFSTTVGVLGGCLFMVYCTNWIRYDFWVMKEYGVRESWTKQFVIDNMHPTMGDSWINYEPMFVLSNGEILMMYNHEAMVCYNHRTKQFRAADFLIQSNFNAIAYTPCFVSVHNVAKGEQISRLQGTRVYDEINDEEFLRQL